MIKKLFIKYKDIIIQFIKFGTVGVINTIDDYIFYRLCLLIKIDYKIAVTIAFILSSLIGYALQKKFVFKSKAKKRQSLVKFYVVYGSSYLLKLGLTILFVEVFHINENYAPLLTMFITIPYNFILSKIWVYKEKKVCDKSGK